MKCSHSHTQMSVSLFWSSLLLVKRDFNQFQDISIWNRIFKIQWDYSASSSHFSFIFFSFFLVLHIRMGRNCWAGSGLNPERFHICFQLFPHQIFVLKCLNTALKQPESSSTLRMHLHDFLVLNSLVTRSSSLLANHGLEASGWLGIWWCIAEAWWRGREGGRASSAGHELCHDDVINAKRLPEPGTWWGIKANPTAVTPAHNLLPG